MFFMIELIATTTFGLEAVVKRELISLGFRIIKTEDGKVTFESDFSGIAKANLWLRSADRVLLKLGEFRAITFDELFEKTKALPWTDWISVNGQFPVNGKSVKSKLFSISDCQRIVKKAVVEKMKTKYSKDFFEETGPNYTIQVSLLKDVATLTIDTSGAGLHKRGYRVSNVSAPIKETLAAALIMLSYWNKDRALYDVFCGSGTIPIEAALIARNIAPGLNRKFASEEWPILDQEIWTLNREEATKAIDRTLNLEIYASDINQENLTAAKSNATQAGVGNDITFFKSDFKSVNFSKDYGIIISNPPYGERLENENIYKVKQMYRDMGKIFNQLETWSKYIITSFEGFENLFEKKADKVRKLYNGKLKVRYYQYYGPRPPKERG
ncbi:class I SAM-dependent RNA methyltransferase [Mycoplasmatota bacterium]|nr:class I SAM-dependent RNA methyltransferase [Mycoplasmatota bacterium]